MQTIDFTRFLLLTEIILQSGFIQKMVAEFLFSRHQHRNQFVEATLKLGIAVNVNQLQLETITLLVRQQRLVHIFTQVAVAAGIKRQIHWKTLHAKSCCPLFFVITTQRKSQEQWIATALHQ